MNGQKRKEYRRGCKCFRVHETDIECKKETDLKAHLATTAKIVLFSETVNVFIGPDKKVFSIHKDLLMIHSGYFADRFRNEENPKLIFPNLKATVFAGFVSYLYTGKLVKISNVALGGRTGELWELGSYLGAPAFQNLCIDDCRNSCKDENQPWPFIQDIEKMYICSKKGSILRKFTAHSMVHNNPFVTNEEGSEEFKNWECLIRRIPDIAMDMAMAAGKKWNGTKPWDDEHRAAYMEKEGPLDERWEKHILSTRTKADIKRDAKANCIRSIIELQHLEREK